jgi:hypothetical protein
MLLCDEIAQQLRARETPPLLPKSAWNTELSQRLNNGDETLSGTEIVCANAASNEAASTRRALCRAALFLWNDDLDAAHAIVQPLESNMTANFIHAVIHRREGDFSNALYWWRRTGPHPLLRNIGLGAREIDSVREYSPVSCDDTFDAVAFTQLCQSASSENREFLGRIQSIELEEIYTFCRAQLP